MYWSLWTEFSCKKTLWVICKILGLFVNPLSADEKYCLLNRGNLLQHFQMELSEKRKTFSQFFLFFLHLDSILNIFRKKMTVLAEYFWTDRLQKTCLVKCIKRPVSEDPSTSNMVNAPKHCWNPNGSIFSIFIDPCEEN